MTSLFLTLVTRFGQDLPWVLTLRVLHLSPLLQVLRLKRALSALTRFLTAAVQWNTEIKNSNVFTETDQAGLLRQPHRHLCAAVSVTIFAFGLLFLGIETMGDVMKPLASSAFFVNMIGKVSHIPILGVCVGAVMTVTITTVSPAPSMARIRAARRVSSCCSYSAAVWLCWLLCVGEFPELAEHIAGTAKTMNLPSVMLGVVSLAILLIAKKRIPKFPMAVVLMAAGAVLTNVLPLQDWGIQTLAAVEPGLPTWSLPDFSAVPLKETVTISLSVAVVIMAETLLAENSFGQKNRYQIDDNQEILAFSLGNFAAAFTGCSASRRS